MTHEVAQAPPVPPPSFAAAAEAPEDAPALAGPALAGPALAGGRGLPASRKRGGALRTVPTMRAPKRPVPTATCSIKPGL